MYRFLEYNDVAKGRIVDERWRGRFGAYSGAGDYKVEHLGRIHEGVGAKKRIRCEVGNGGVGGCEVGNGGVGHGRVEDVFLVYGGVAERRIIDEGRLGRFVANGGLGDFEIEDRGVFHDGIGAKKEMRGEVGNGGVGNGGAGNGCIGHGRVEDGLLVYYGVAERRIVDEGRLGRFVANGGLGDFEIEDRGPLHDGVAYRGVGREERLGRDLDIVGAGGGGAGSRVGAEKDRVG